MTQYLQEYEMHTKYFKYSEHKPNYKKAYIPKAPKKNNWLFVLLRNKITSRYTGILCSYEISAIPQNHRPRVQVNSTEASLSHSPVLHGQFL